MPRIIGILNITPDSFSDGGKFLRTEDAFYQTEKLIQEGADMIDIGAESTRPGSQIISAKEEWNRLKEILPSLLQQEKFRGKISLDTKNPDTVEKFFTLGGKWINAVDGAQNERTCEIIAKNKGNIIVNHFPGKNINIVHEQKISSINQVQDDLLKNKQKIISLGVDETKIILDPGIGFGKTNELNHKLLFFAEILSEEKILIGFSRKRFLGSQRFNDNHNLMIGKKILQTNPWGIRVHNPKGYQRST